MSNSNNKYLKANAITKTKSYVNINLIDMMRNCKLFFFIEHCHFKVSIRIK